MTGPNGLALLQKHASEQPPKLSTIAGMFFPQVDLVLVEGGRNEGRLKKIELLREGIADEVETPAGELIAVVSDVAASTDRPVFRFEQIAEIADLLENHREGRDSHVRLHVDGKSIPIKLYVQTTFANVIMGMVSALKGIPRNPKRVALSLTRAKTTDE
jgi:hypothetical protein